MNRDKANRDVLWLHGESLQEPDNLPDPASNSSGLLSDLVFLALSRLDSQELLLSQFVQQREVIDLVGLRRLFQPHVPLCQFSVKFLRTGCWSSIERP